MHCFRKVVWWKIYNQSWCLIVHWGKQKNFTKFPFDRAYLSVYIEKEGRLRIPFRKFSMTKTIYLLYQNSACCISGKATQNIPDIYSESFWSSSKSADYSSTSPLAALGINNNFANHPLLAVLENRISSFLTYSHTYRSAIDVDSLAEAGYFYQGIYISIKTFLASK